MTDLQFRYDGYKRPERRGGEMCFFPPRFCMYGYGDLTSQSDEEEKDEEPASVKEKINLPEATTTNATEKEEVVDKPGSAQVSEMLIENLTITETNLNDFKGQVEVAKKFVNELVFKLDSFMQILEIVKTNEERRVSDSEAEVASIKTSKDTVDELLELMQSPVFQNILRQFLISVLVKKDDVTNYEHTT